MKPLESFVKAHNDELKVRAPLVKLMVCVNYFTSCHTYRTSLGIFVMCRISMRHYRFVWLLLLLLLLFIPCTTSKEKTIYWGGVDILQ